MEEKQTIQMRKRNMKLFPICKALGWDYIFFYTTNFLFLTQVKNIDPADVVLIDSFYALFGIVMQVPATFIIEYLGRRRSIILANFLNCMYMIIIMFSRNLFDLIIAELLSALAFAIKDSAELALLNESIPASRYKGQIFAKINERGISNYYIINAISTILSGFLYDVNPYIPIILALTTTLFLTILSRGFVEPPIILNKKKNKKDFSEIKNLKESFKFILKSERLKSLILFSAITVGVFNVLTNYEISLLENLDIDAKYLGIIFAVLGIISGIVTKKQEVFHNKHRNKTLSLILGGLGISIIISGIAAIIATKYRIFIIFIIISYVIKYAYKGIYNPLMDKYLRNFSNEEIDTKIFTAKNFFGSIFSVIIGVFASFILERMDIAICMTLIGIITVILTIIMDKYMKTRVGLKPEEYSKEERKYDELNQKTEKGAK